MLDKITEIMRVLLGGLILIFICTVFTLLGTTALRLPGF